MIHELSLLDQLSTSQTNSREIVAKGEISDEEFRALQSEIAAAEWRKTLECDNHAPFIFFVDANGTARLVQGCCNSWTCERCGHIRALHEYGRMVHGGRELAKLGECLYFLTLTCRGREMSLDEAEAGYLGWTNSLLTTLRTKQKRVGKTWAYASVTERQKRGHPHSHFVTTFEADDVVPYAKGKRLPNGAIAKHDTLYSNWLETSCIKVGLGRMVDYSIVVSPVAASVYIAKYLFKSTVETMWPAGWRRVRYSQSWPKLPEISSPLAFPLVHFTDWLRMQSLGYTVHADSAATLAAAVNRSIVGVVFREADGGNLDGSTTTEYARA